MAVSVIKADIVVLYPELSGVPETQVNATVAMARAFVSEDVFSPNAKLALTLYSAHLLMMAEQRRGGAAGPLTSETVGKLSRSYAAPSQQSNQLMNTSAGQQFKILRDAAIAGTMKYVDQDSQGAEDVAPEL